MAPHCIVSNDFDLPRCKKPEAGNVELPVEGLFGVVVTGRDKLEVVRSEVLREQEASAPPQPPAFNSTDIE